MLTQQHRRHVFNPDRPFMYSHHLHLSLFLTLLVLILLVNLTLIQKMACKYILFAFLATYQAIFKIVVHHFIFFTTVILNFSIGDSD